MARLTEEEKKALLEATFRPVPRPPPPPVLSPEDYLAFATFASQFQTAPKPVRFGGKHWKL